MGYSKMRKAELIEKIEALQGRIAELEHAQAERKRAEETLRESQQLLERTSASLLDAVFIIDADTVEIMDCNPVASEIFGYSHQEMLGRTTTFLHVDEAALEEFKRHLYPAIEEKGFLSYLGFRMKRKDGTVFPTEHSVMPIKDEQGKRIGWVSVVRDITARKRAEEELRLHSEIMTNMVEGVILTRVSDGTIVYTNPKFEEMSGYGHGELVGKNISVVNAPTEKSPEEIAKDIQRSLKKTGVWSGQVHNLKEDGTPFWCYANVSTFEHPEYGEVWVAVHTDITGRKRAEEALRNSKEELQAIFDGVKDGIVLIDMTGKVIKINKRIMEIGGYTEEEIVGKRLKLLKMFPPPSLAKMLFNFTKLISGQGVPPFGIQVYTKTGEKLDAELRGSLLRKSGKAVGMIGVMRDITERKRAEEALRESEAQYRALFNNVVDPVFIFDRETNLFLDCNQTAISRYGYTLDELRTMTPAQLHPPDEVEIAERNISDEEDSLPHYYTHITKDGGHLQVEIRTDEIEYKGRGAWLSVARDITERKRAEEALQESEMRYRSLFERVPVGLYRSTPDGHILDANNAAIHMLGYPDRETALTIDAIDAYVEPEDWVRWKALMDRDGVVRNFEVEWRRYDGVTIWVKDSARAVRDAEGRVLYYEGSFEDITDRKRAEEELDQFFNLSFDMLCVSGFDGYAKRVNPAFEKTLGYTAEEILARPFLDFVHPEDRAATIAKLQKLATGTPSVHFEQRCRCKDGSYKWLAWTNVPVVEEGLMYAAARDITERKRMEEALRESEEKYRTILENIEDSYFEVDIAGNFTFFNDPLCRLLGYSEDELMGMNNRQYMDDVNAKALYQTFNAVYRTGKPARAFDWEVIRKDGTTRFVEASVSLLRDSTGEPAGFRGVVRDITERKRAEEAISYQASLLQNVSDAIIASDLELRITSWNKAAEQTYGWKEDEVIGKMVDDVCKTEFLRDTQEEAQKRLLDEGYWQGEVLQKRKDDEAFHTMVAVSWIKDSNGNPIGGVTVNRDITERKRAEEELRESEAQYRHLVEGSPDIVWSFSDKHGTLYASARVGEILGYSPDYLCENPWLWNKSIHPDHQDHIAQAITDFAAGKDLDVEYRIKDSSGNWHWFRDRAIGRRVKDGETIIEGISTDITEGKRAEEEIARLAKFPSENPNPVLRVAVDGTVLYTNKASLPLLNVWACQVDQPLPGDWRKLTLDVLSSGASEDVEVEVEDRVLSLTFAPVVEADYVNVYGFDITERKRAGEMKDNLIRDVSHELKTPLAKMQMSVEQLMETVGTPSIDRQNVVRVSAIVTGNVQRLQSTVNSILDLSSLESGRVTYHKTRVQPEKLIRQVIVDMGPLAEAKGLELAAELPDGLPQLEGDREELLRVLTNLVDNAVKFSDQGKIVVSAKMQKAHEIEIAVSDSGRGIPRENLDRVFERFWQENPSIPGAGTGLAICKTIVEAHGGRIWAESARGGQGATVRFTLPVG